MWRYCREMAVPDSLTETIALFRRRGHLPKYKDGLFSPPSWLSVLMGQGVSAARHHPMADGVPGDKLLGEMARVRGAVADAVAAMPAHDAFLADYCPAAVAC